MTEIDYEGISSGVRGLVRIMREVHGYDTCDSGDGSNCREGMGCALPVRHVFMQFDSREEAESAYIKLSRLYPSATVEVTDEDDSGIDFVLFWPDGVPA